MMKENKNNNPVNLFDKNSDSRRKKNANNIVKFAGTGGFTTVHDNFEIYHLPVTCTPMPLIERDYNYRWNYPSRILDEHRRPQHDDKISSARSLECVSKLEDRVLRDVNVPKPVHNLEIVRLFSNFSPSSNHLETVFQKRAADFQHKTRP